MKTLLKILLVFFSIIISGILTGLLSSNFLGDPNEDNIPGFILFLSLLLISVIVITRNLVYLFNNLYWNIKNQGDAKPLKKYFRNIGITYFLYFSISFLNPLSIYHGGESFSNEKAQQCEQYQSKKAVETRISSLGHIQTSIQLNSSSGCRHQWLVQFITNSGGSGYCAITTDGSGGTVEIVEVGCN